MGSASTFDWLMVLLKYMERRWCAGGMRYSASPRTRAALLALPKAWRRQWHRWAYSMNAANRMGAADRLIQGLLDRWVHQEGCWRARLDRSEALNDCARSSGFVAVQTGPDSGLVVSAAMRTTPHHVSR